LKLSLAESVEILTEELIISKADIDFETDIEKREYAESLQLKLLELLR